MMRIAMLGSFPPDPTKVHGGVAAVIRNLATEIAKLPDTDVHVLNTVPGADGQRHQNWQGLTIHNLPGQSAFGNLTLHWRDRRTLARATSDLRPDIVHAHGTDARAAAALQTSFAVVVTVHGILYREMVAGRDLRAALRRHVMTALERRVLGQAGDIITIARYVQDAVEPYTSARFHRIANPVHSRFFDQETSDDGTSVLSVATVQPRKGQLVLVDAFARIHDRFPEARLRLIGKPVDRQYAAAVRDRIEQHDLADSVELAGFKSDEELEHAFRTCTAFILGSREESSPVSIAEAMTLGKPVIATRVGGVPDLVDDGKTGYVVDYGDVAGTAWALERILGDAEHRRSFGQAARVRAERDFHPAAIARRTRDVYEKILEEHSRR
jgi:glycosyltransferase involved in cell wall biosynthesis